MEKIAWPQPNGPHAVGVREFEITDFARPAAYAPTYTPHRTIKVMAWYPARPASTDVRRTYFDKREASGQARSVVQMMPDAEARFAALGELVTYSFVDADIAPGRHPLLVYCHGFCSYIQHNMLLIEHLASHGYIVLSLGHPNESSGYYLEDGSAVDMSPAMMEAVAQLDHMPEFQTSRHAANLAERRTATEALLKKLRATPVGHLAQVQADDNVFIVDRFIDRSLPDEIIPLAEACDFDRLGYIGMSYGGHVSALSCMKDPRAKAGVNLDGNFASAEPYGRELGVPFLSMNRDIHALGKLIGIESEPTAPHSMVACDLAYERSDGVPPMAPVDRFTLIGGMHWDFMDARLLTPGGLPPGLLGDLPAMPTVEAVGRAVLDFLDARLRQRENGYPASTAAALADRLVLQDRQAMLARFG